MPMLASILLDKVSHRLFRLYSSSRGIAAYRVIVRPAACDLRLDMVSLAQHLVERHELKLAPLEAIAGPLDLGPAAREEDRVRGDVGADELDRRGRQARPIGPRHRLDEAQIGAP